MRTPDILRRPDTKPTVLITALLAITMASGLLVAPRIIGSPSTESSTQRYGLEVEVGEWTLKANGSLPLNDFFRGTGERFRLPTISASGIQIVEREYVRHRFTEPGSSNTGTLLFDKNPDDKDGSEFTITRTPSGRIMLIKRVMVLEDEGGDTHGKKFPALAADGQCVVVTDETNPKAPTATVKDCQIPVDLANPRK